MRRIPTRAWLSSARVSHYGSGGSPKPKGFATGGVDGILTFVLLLSEDKTHIPDLNSLHDFIRTFYLARHDDELAALKKDARPGRSRPKKLIELDDRIATEAREYREGMIMPDLMDETNVALLREWEGDPQAIPLFRFIRVSGTDRELCKVVQGGTHKLLQGK
ncbi:translation machinery-associated protein 16 [Malassezia sp. CBS 17886]|nr:translation machinery-associated protein 16 [Malassezia sp. CBS 17886]